MKVTNLLRGAAALSLVAVAVAAPAARAQNLLVDPGFESNPLVTAGDVLNDFTTYQGQWGVEAATITGPDGGITPAAGLRMLRMTDDGLVATQGFQITDVTSYAAQIDAGAATANASALVNALIQGGAVPAGVGGVTLSFFSAANFGSQIGVPSTGNITMDNNPATWEVAATSTLVPVNTRWILTQVAFNNASMQGHPGYVDETRLVIVPEPASLTLLAAGALGLLARRRRPS